MIGIGGRIIVDRIVMTIYFMFFCSVEGQALEMTSNRPLTYDNFMAMRDVKVAERQSHFSKKGGRPKRKQAVSVSTSTVSPVHLCLLMRLSFWNLITLVCPIAHGQCRNKGGHIAVNLIWCCMSVFVLYTFHKANIILNECVQFLPVKMSCASVFTLSLTVLDMAW